MTENLIQKKTNNYKYKYKYYLTHNGTFTRRGLFQTGLWDATAAVN